MPKLNLGSGLSKIKGFLSVDSTDEVKPDIKHDLTKFPYPWDSGTIDEIVWFHCIEHVPKKFHEGILGELYRIMKWKALLTISYPEFNLCYENWKSNYRGQREFWEATMFGAQRFPSDFHVCAMETEELVSKLTKIGFEVLKVSPESEVEPFNTVVFAKKVDRTIYEDTIYDQKADKGDSPPES